MTAASRSTATPPPLRRRSSTAPLKPRPHRRVLHEPLSFCRRSSTAPLKLEGGLRDEELRHSFRRRSSTAPLKLVDPREQRRAHRVFPSTKLDGPIEASTPCRAGSREGSFRR